ncbi:uncharacterized WD repeat-containing protein C2A9.03-like [Typha angustifolia]|uniref:uncharacterized WD repeat-containing protein C2A9.03-like n=1 Tax=Typha angustifolia TaxID=59011 RepID=UPI003C30BE72
MALYVNHELDHMVELGGIIGFAIDDDPFEDNDQDREGGDLGLEIEGDDELDGHATDTSALDARNGKDIQGIPWERMSFTRDMFREIRLERYKNYENLYHPRDQLEKECKQVDKGSTFYYFQYNTRLVNPSIVHFQLRNLLWATSKHDIYMTQRYSVNHWSSLQQTNTEVLNVAGQIVPAQMHHGSLLQSVSRVQISTMTVKDNLMVAGGFQGELICKYLNQPGVIFSTRVTDDENAITNSVEIYQNSNGSTSLMMANNDCHVRIFDVTNFNLINQYIFPWSVNSTSVSPDGKLLAVLGDDVNCLVADSNTGKAIGTLKGHLDYSFASAWHPDGHILATGNQDTTCRLWDIRKLSESLMTLRGRMGAIRGIKFSSDGCFMSIAQPADFVHIYDVKAGYDKAQEIDLFGEIAGVAFSPDTEALFVGVADRTFGCLLEFNRRHQYQYMDYY